MLEKIAAGKDRILLTLATGTGKTSIAFQTAWKLFQARWSLGGEPTRRPRILFLADRNTLANQAFNDFTSFNAFADDAMVRVKPDDIRKKGKVPKNANLFFTIFQTFMSGPEKDGKPSPYFGDYPPDFFDFIVIDECYRGGANDESTWRGILEYFAPAVHLGLTATPKRKDNIDTYKYFGEPVFIYSLKDGINDGFLTPFRVKQISTTLDEYVYTPDDSLIEGDIEVGKRYVEKDFNKVIEIKEREAHRVRLFMDQISQHDKTLVFCASQAHALAARDLVNQMKISKDPGYCPRVTANDGELGEENLRAFQDNEKTVPTILTTSQKLSTGVDARNIRNIVLMRPINSMIEFKQIIGRGTRLCDGKDYFTIYDFVKAHHHFSDPEWDGEPVEPEPSEPKAPKPYPPDEPAPNPQMADGTEAKPRPARIKVKLADGKARTIQHMMCTTFWHPDGTPMSAQQFMDLLFGKLPRLLQERSGAARPVERPRHPQAPARRPGRQRLRQAPAPRDAEDHRRRKERPLRRAGPRGLRPGAAHPRRARPARQGGHQPPFQQQATYLPRLRALALRGRGRGRAGPRQADPAPAPAMPRQHRRRRRRPRPRRRDRPRLQRLPEAPVRTGGGVVTAMVEFSAPVA